MHPIVAGTQTKEEKSRIEQITILHKEIEDGLRMSIEKVLKVAKLLVEQKKTLKHGLLLKRRDCQMNSCKGLTRTRPISQSTGQSSTQN